MTTLESIRTLMEQALKTEEIKHVMEAEANEALWNVLHKLPKDELSRKFNKAVSDQMETMRDKAIEEAVPQIVRKVVEALEIKWTNTKPEARELENRIVRELVKALAEEHRAIVQSKIAEMFPPEARERAQRQVEQIAIEVGKDYLRERYLYAMKTIEDLMGRVSRLESETCNLPNVAHNLR